MDRKQPEEVPREDLAEKAIKFYKSVACHFAEGVELMNKEQVYDALKEKFNAMNKQNETRRRVKCCECEWTGDKNDTDRVKSVFLADLGIVGWEHACPNCGHDDFYKL